MVRQLCWRSKSLHLCLISVRNWCTEVFLWLTLQKQPWCGERWMQKLGSCCWAILGLWTQSYQTFLLYAYSRPAYSFACFTCCQSYRYDFCLASSFSFISPQSSSNKNRKVMYVYCGWWMKVLRWMCGSSVTIAIDWVVNIKYYCSHFLQTVTWQHGWLISSIIALTFCKL